ncbi:hypothetical protein COOONC_04079, partial [Cooperia oncophora]
MERKWGKDVRLPTISSLDLESVYQKKANLKELRNTTLWNDLQSDRHLVITEDQMEASAQKKMLLLALLLTAIPLSRAASCGGSAIPFRFEVLPSGNPVLGCASPSCFGGGPGGSQGLSDTNFQ